MRSVYSLILAGTLVGTGTVQGQWTFEGNRAPTWEEAITRYQQLDSLYAGAKLFTIGRDDGGQPIHLFVLSDGAGFTPDSIRAAGKNILWITNGIHPGEPDGIDASLLLAQALLDSDQLMGLLNHSAVCIVPVYNVSGYQDRGSRSRVNQNGPEEYGFRGNAKYLDLNRDFMKMDSRNMQAMARALSYWDPDIYFETHVSDGADHQYVMTLMTTETSKMAPPLFRYMLGELVPAQYQWMGKKGMAMCPYFELMGDSPEEGLRAFYDSPRYSTGYNALFNRVAMLSESHVLKPYADRVNATFQLLLGTLAAMDGDPGALRMAREQAKEFTAEQDGFGINLALDTNAVDSLPWRGYTARRETSQVTGLQRIRYDHDAPITTVVRRHSSFGPGHEVTKPKAYLIPGQWAAAVQRLEWSGVPLIRLDGDTVLHVQQDSIVDFHTVSMAYEGHYLHRDIQRLRKRKTLPVKAGDVLVPMGHPTDRYVVEALESAAEDGFFAWNFFDAILQQKEWFDGYIFEDIAADMLAKNPALKEAFEAKRRAEPEFAESAWVQLIWLYRRSPWMEPGFRMYPVLRVVE